MTEEARDALRVAIVGAGAAGLATAAALLRQAPGQVRIDIFDRRATPFGMIRTAVAPDHEEGRQVLERYEPLFDVPAVRFLGLVELGRDVHRDDLLTAYDAVVYATGAYADRLLDVPGENLPGVCSGRQFAEWYTGTPGARPFDLNGVTNAVIVGLGDVALDLARVLLKNPEDFRATEMPAEVIDQLAAHRVREVTVLVADATHLALSLRLVLDVKRLGLPLVVALNMSDLAKARGYAGVATATSGNYGAGVASQAAMRDLRCIILQDVFDSRGVGQPEIVEKSRACEAYGAEVQRLHLLAHVVARGQDHHRRAQALATDRRQNVVAAPLG